MNDHTHSKTGYRLFIFALAEVEVDGDTLILKDVTRKMQGEDNPYSKGYLRL